MKKTGKPNFRGVLVLEDYHGKDDHLRIGSAHTTEVSPKNIGTSYRFMGYIYSKKDVENSMGKL